MKTFVSDRHGAIEAAAEDILSFCRSEKNAGLAFSWDECLSALYGRLAELCRENRMAGLNGARILQVMEFEGGNPAIMNALEKDLLSPAGIPAENVFRIDLCSPQSYESTIERLGGIGLCVLSLGAGGRFGFNEPGTQYSSLTMRRKISKTVAGQYAGILGGVVPEYGCTMGVKTVVSAAGIIVLALGTEKAESVFSMLYARDDSLVPAAFLQLPANVNVYLDEAAASKL